MPKILNKTGGDKNTTLMIMKLNVFLGNYFIYLMILFLIVLLVSGYFFIVKPKYDKVSLEIENITNTKQGEYDVLEKQYIKIRSIWNDYQELNQRDIEKMHKMLPGRDETEELFRQLEVMFSRSGLKVSSINISEDSAIEDEGAVSRRKTVKKVSSSFSDIGRIKIQLSLTGVDYEQFKKLLSTIENNLRLMDIDDLSVSLKKGSVSLGITTYYLKSKGNNSKTK